MADTEPAADPPADPPRCAGARAGARAGAVAARLRSLRRDRPVRPLHPDGRAFTADVTLWGTPGRPWGAAILDRPGHHRAAARLSRGAGTPAGWPDVLGLALRVDLPTGPFDLLLSTTGRVPVLRHTPLPRRTFTATYGSVLTYLAGPAGRPGARLLFAALPVPGVTALGTTLDSVVGAAGRPAGRFVLAVATRLGGWWPFGAVALDAPLPADVAGGLAFDPTRRHPPDLRPVGLIQILRGAVYRGAQAARGAPARQGVPADAAAAAGPVPGTAATPPGSAAAG